MHIYCIFSSNVFNSVAKIELKIKYFPNKEESVYDNLLEFPNLFNALERSGVIDREEMLAESWREKEINVRLINEEWIDRIMP